MPYNISLLGITGPVVQAAAAANIPAMDIDHLPYHTIWPAVQGDISKENGI